MTVKKLGHWVHKSPQLNPKTKKAAITPIVVTAIAWDVELGTEKTTKRILVGTESCEIFDALGLSVDDVKGDSHNNSKSVGGLESFSFLTKLDSGDDEMNSNSKAQPAATATATAASICGLYFLRSNNSSQKSTLTILASTSGPTSRTRLHTFTSTTQPPTFAQVS
tara:strand:- start:82 stop:579 length:498 start_codon:yes stop_codon:yes gene_type:complete